MKNSAEQITKDETQEKWFLTESYDEKYEQPVIDVTSINDDCFATFWSGANKGDAISCDLLLSGNLKYLLFLLLQILLI
jgi:hypothetical protein